MNRYEYKHMIYCETEDKWITVIKTNQTVLTECPNNAGHTITSDSASITRKVKSTREISIPCMSSETYAQGNGSTAYWHYTGFWGTEARSQMKMPSCTIKELSGYFLNNLTGGSTLKATVTIMKNEQATEITGNLTSTGRFSLTGSVEFTNGDLMDIKVVTTGNGGNVSFSGGEAKLEV